jgi:HEAT repeat protein
MAQGRSMRNILVALLLVSLLCTLAVAAPGLAVLRERLLSPDTPATDRPALVALLIERGEEGEAVLREALRGRDANLARTVLRVVLVRVHRPLLGDALARAEEGDLATYRSGTLAAALEERASAGDEFACTALEWAGGPHAVDALIRLWAKEVPRAQEALRVVLPRDFASAEVAASWWEQRRGRPFEKVLAELVRPPARLRKLEEALAGLGAEHVALARACLDRVDGAFIAERYLGSRSAEIRRIGAEALRERRDLPDEQSTVVAVALAAALRRPDEEPATLLAVIGAARAHVVALRALPEGRACRSALPLLATPYPEVLGQGVELLGDLGDARAIDGLTGLYDREEGVDAALRARILSSLTRIGDGVGVWASGALEAQLDLGAARERELTSLLVNLLGKRGDARVVPALVRTLKDVTDDGEIRRFAAAALGAAGVAKGSAEAVEALIEVGLSDESAGVRVMAAMALEGAKGSPTAVRALEERLAEDDKEAVRRQAARSLLALRGAASAPAIAACVGDDAVLAKTLDEATAKAFENGELGLLVASVGGLLESAPARAVDLSIRIRAKVWPPARSADLARVALLHAEALVRTEKGEKALEVLDGLAAAQGVPAAEIALVRSRALRQQGRAADAVAVVDGALGNGSPPGNLVIPLEIERIHGLLAAGRIEGAVRARTGLLAREDLGEKARADLEALGRRIEEVRDQGDETAVRLVEGWLAGASEGSSFLAVRELGTRAYPVLRTKLRDLDAQDPATLDLAARLRELTGKSFGFEAAETPEARVAARQRWLDFLSGR